MKKVVIYFIKIYQKIISPDTGIYTRLGFKKSNTCAFYPTCSNYCIQVIQKYGLFKGFFMTIKRILKCHPWQKNNIDLP